MCYVNSCAEKPAASLEMIKATAETFRTTIIVTLFRRRTKAGGIAVTGCHTSRWRSFIFDLSILIFDLKFGSLSRFYGCTRV